MSKKPVDLGDFIPETYGLRFSVEGRKYEFNFSEATIDEILKLMWEPQEKEEDVVDQQRRVVTKFLLQNAPAEMDTAQLEKDLATVPYRSMKAGLDIKKLYEAIHQRIDVKKN